MIGLMFAPALIIAFNTPEKKVVNVIDNTHRLLGHLHNNDEIEFVNSNLPADSLRNNEEIETILVIGPNAITNPSKDITLMSRGSMPMMTSSYISSELKEAIETERLNAYNIPDIKNILDNVETDVSIATVRIDRDQDTATSSELSYFMALTLDMLLYMFILLYGQQVMTSIIEEKNNRVLEIVVSSVKPFYLMLGKIIGIGLVAVTQILIWGAILSVASGIAMPLVGNAVQGGDVEMAGAISQLSDAGYLASLFIYILFFFIGGFLLYSALFAAIGSAVSNIQDASQLSSVATMPIIISIIASMAVISDPDSTLSFWVSIFPLTSPMGMMARLPFGVPFWEIILSLALLYASFIFMIWLCGKIYRIGIFMYGKKPTIIEIIKWAKEK